MEIDLRFLRKTFFLWKGPRNKKISLVVGEKIISEDNEVSESFNTFSRDAVQQLDIQEDLHLLNKSNNTDNLIEYDIEKFESHPSILKIKEKVNSPIFNFRNVSLVDVEKEVKSLNPKKANTTNSIPSNLLKQHFDIYGPILHNLVNETFQENIFPEELKLADITPIFKKEDATNQCQLSLKYLKGFCKNKLYRISKNTSLPLYVVIGKGSTSSMHSLH